MLFSDYQLELVIDFLRWREEKITERTLSVAKLKNEKRGTASTVATAELKDLQDVGKYSEEDLRFNYQTGFGELVPTDIGKVAKTKLWRATKNKSELLFTEHKSIIVKKFGSAEKVSRFKTLLHCFLWSSSVSARAEYWPNAKDIDYVISTKSEIESRLHKYTPFEIIKAFEFYREYWSAIFPDFSSELNTTLLADVLDKAYETAAKKSKATIEYNCIEAPLVKEILALYPEIDKEQLKNRIEVNNFNYIDSIRQELFGAFKKARPRSIPETGNDWKMDIPTFLPQYRKEIDAALTQCREKTSTSQEEFEKARKQVQV